MKRGLSLVELLTVCAVVGILAGLLMVEYNSLRKQAEEAAGNRDQVVLEQLLGALRMMGASILPIVSDTTATLDDKAQALTLVLQGAVAKNLREQRGAIGEFLSADKVIVPYPSATYPENGKSRLCISNKGNLSIAKQGAGYIVISQSAGNRISDKAQALANGVLHPATISPGSRYASGRAYLWDNGTGNPGPTAPRVQPPLAVTVLPGLVVELSVVKVNPTLADYGSDRAIVSIKRSDAQPLSTSDMSGVTLAFRLNSNVVGVPCDSGYYQSDDIVLCSVQLPSILAAKDWPVTQLTLQAHAKGKPGVLANGVYDSNAVAVTAQIIKLNPPLITASNSYGNGNPPPKSSEYLDIYNGVISIDPDTPNQGTAVALGSVDVTVASGRNWLDVFNLSQNGNSLYPHGLLLDLRKF